MADFTAIQIGAEKINVKDETARATAEQAATDATAAKTAAEQAASDAAAAETAAGQAASDAATAKQQVESISFTYNGTDTIIWNGGN